MMVISCLLFRSTAAEIEANPLVEWNQFGHYEYSFLVQDREAKLLWMKNAVIFTWELQVTHVWADAIYARLLQLLCIQVCVYIYIYTLPSLKLLPALLFALLSKLIACTVFLHLWSVVVPSICLALRQSYKGSLWKGQVVLMKYITGYLLVGFETSGILGWDWSKPKSDVN